MRTSRTGRSPADQRGFTLVELLVVLTVIALLATLAGPLARKTLPSTELKAQAEELRSDLRALRGLAISQNRETWMLIDVAGKIYSDGDRRRSRRIPPAIGVELVTAETELVDTDKGRIRFYPDGTSTGGTVRLRRDDASLELRVDWFDGTVELREAHVE